MALPQPRSWVLDIPLYQGGKSEIKGVNRVIKLSSNEAALGPSPKALTAYAAANTLHRYPQDGAADLRTAIAEIHGLDPARIICGVGSDEVLCLLCRAFAGPGDEVIHTEHAYSIYAIFAKSVGAKPVAVPETDLTANVDAILSAVTPRTRLVFLANPNNPTGTYISGAELNRLRAQLREDIVLVVDAAYAEFTAAADYDDGFALAATTPNTFVTRTFSKIYGLASLRLGWGTGPAEIIGAMERLRPPFNISAPALAAGAAAVRDVAHTAAAKAHNAKWMKIAVQRLRGLGFNLGGDSANFVLPEFPAQGPKSAAAADAYLQSRGIIVRRVSNYGLPNHLRITLGNDEDMTAVLDALAAFMEGRS
ncbi:MAG: histidinol-phosphate transaminase [Rhodospirillaceae bacterium]|nr:MAG: histidinol-phosphate transaminase [Rhodospirillaceae bacterium]